MKGQKSEIKVSAGLVLSGCSEGGWVPCLSLLASGGCQQCLAVDTSLQSLLPSSHAILFLCVSMSSLLQWYWFLEPFLIHRLRRSDLIFTWLYLQRPYLQIRAYSQVLEVRISTYLIFFFLATPHRMWDLSFLTRDQTCASCIGKRNLNH